MVGKVYMLHAASRNLWNDVCLSAEPRAPVSTESDDLTHLVNLSDFQFEPCDVAYTDLIGLLVATIRIV